MWRFQSSVCPASLLFTSGYDEAGMDSASTLQCDLQKPGRWEPWKPIQRNTDKKIGWKIHLKAKDIYIYIWYMICYNIHGCRKNTIDVWWYLKYMKGWNKYVDNVESHMKNHSNRNWNPYNSLFIVVCFFHSFVKPRRKGDIVTYEHGVCFSQ